jgi:predicted glycosyltransferase
MKALGLLRRSVQMLPKAFTVKPRLAVSHGSRTQLMVARILGIPSVLIADYEHVVHIAQPDVWVMPEILSASINSHDRAKRLTYPGLKEHVYASSFIPSPDFLDNYPVSPNDIVVTLRPPATEAHYHDARGEQLFADVTDDLLKNRDVRLFLLPRNQRQKREILARWSNAVLSGKMIIPGAVLSGLDLLWYSDLVISGGGTMNREAAALGVPVYSIFKGKQGAVDQYLEKTGQLRFLDDLDGFRRMVKLEKRTPVVQPVAHNNLTLNAILNIITDLATEGLPP